MKNFRICNHDLENWIEKNFYHAIEVVRFIKNKKLTTFEIEWKTPVTGEYKTLLYVENGVKTFENDLFKIPCTFKNLVK